MTRFIDTHSLTAMVQHVGVSGFLQQLVAYMDADFRNWSRFEKSARLASHTEIGVIELMPVTDGQYYGFKYVNGHPANATHGLPTVMAFGALCDVETGTPLLLSELTLSTALRTAATSVLAARYQARPDARRMAIIGCGAQSEFQAIAFHRTLGINDMALFDTDARAKTKVMRNLAAYPELRLTCADGVADAVAGADIITTLTASKRHADVVPVDLIQPGVHINAVGGDCPGKTELHPDVLLRSRIVVEYEPQTRHEGEIQQLPPDSPVTALWQVIQGTAPGRETPDEITLFDSVGFALEDFSTLRLLHDMAQQQGAGQDIALVPDLDNPRDLFQLMRTPADAEDHAGAGAAVEQGTRSCA
ncbi:MAG TPA: ornithine cyclodeaminase [Gammaproteobacteria bacterium]|nr:ornithine cyclodeaminase [Gammaproteobacteria bacterium]